MQDLISCVIDRRRHFEQALVRHGFGLAFAMLISFDLWVFVGLSVICGDRQFGIR